MAIQVKQGERRGRPGLYFLTRNKEPWATDDSEEEPIIPSLSGEHHLLADANGVIIKTADGKYIAVRTQGGQA